MYLSVLKDILDVVILTFIVYKGVQFFAETRAIRLAMGVMILVIAFLLAISLNLSGLLGIFAKFDPGTAGIVVLAVLFAPEIREALARAVPHTRFREIRIEEKRMIQEIVKAAQRLSSKNIGALIVLQREDGLGDFIRSGVPLDSKVSAPLLESIFHPTSPLHDGAALIKENRIIAAKCILPLSDSLEMKRDGHGTRHRAALGLSEQRDAVTIVVSEETGNISMAERKKILKYDDLERLEDELLGSFVEPMRRAERMRKFDLKKALRSNLRWKMAALLVSLVFWAFQYQNLPVVTSVVYDHKGRPKDPKQMQKGDPLVLNPEVLENPELWLRGKNYQLYQILWGILSDREFLKGSLQISFDENDADQKYEVQFDGAVWGGGGMEVVEPLPEPGRFRRKEIELKVARVEPIDKTEIRLDYDDRIHSTLFRAGEPDIQFDDPSTPLFCRLGEREKVLAALGQCKTDKPIVVELSPDRTPEPIEVKDLQFHLPPDIRDLSINSGQNRIAKVIIPIVRSGETDPDVEAVERVLADAKKQADALEIRANERISAIERGLEEIKQDAILKQLDLATLDLAESRLEQMPKDIAEWNERIDVLTLEIQEDEKRIDELKNKATPELPQDELEKIHGEESKAQLIRGARRLTTDHIKRSIRSTTRWMDTLAQWVPRLRDRLQEVIETRDLVESKQQEIDQAGANLDAADDEWKDHETGERRATLRDALQKRTDLMVKLPEDPWLRLGRVGELLRDDLLAQYWQDCERRLRDQQGLARARQIQVRQIADTRSQIAESDFPALTRELAVLEEKEGALLEMNFRIGILRKRLEKYLHTEAHRTIKNEYTDMESILERLEKELPETAFPKGEALEALRGLAADLDQVLARDAEQRAKLSEDLPVWEQGLRAIQEKITELEKEEEIDVAFRELLEDEEEATKEIWDHLDDRGLLLASRIPVLKKVIRLLEPLKETP